MEIDVNELAPWVAIAVTLILSILVPVFTQIANNRFQLKKAKQDRKLDEENAAYIRKIDAFEHFLMDVGRVIQNSNNENLSAAGASIGRMYLYIPNDYVSILDSLYENIRRYDWDNAQKQFQSLAKLISEEYIDCGEKTN